MLYLMMLIVRYHLLWGWEAGLFFYRMPRRPEKNADVYISHIHTSLFSVPFSFITVIFLKPYENSSSRQNRHTFDSNHSRKKGTELCWSNWLYPIFTAYLATERSGVDACIYVYVRILEKHYWWHAYTHIFTSYSVKEKRRVVYLVHKDRKVKNQSCLQDVRTVVCIRLSYI